WGAGVTVRGWRGPAAAPWLPAAGVAPWLAPAEGAGPATGVVPWPATGAAAAAAPAPGGPCRTGAAPAAQPPASSAATASAVTARAVPRSRRRAPAGGESLTVDRMPHPRAGPSHDHGEP